MSKTNKIRIEWKEEREEYRIELPNGLIIWVTDFEHDDSIYLHCLVGDVKVRVLLVSQIHEADYMALVE